jgi:hypothetical protein
VDRLSGLGQTTKPRLGTRSSQFPSQVHSVGGWHAKERDGFKRVVDVPKQNTELGLADADCIIQHSLEYRFKLAGRARDDTEHVRGRGLLLQCLGETFLCLGEVAGALIELFLEIGGAGTVMSRNRRRFSVFELRRRMAAFFH